jgi:hypothetical protein
MLKICSTLVMILLVISVTTAEPTCPVIAKDESCGVQLEQWKPKGSWGFILDIVQWLVLKIQ